MVTGLPKAPVCASIGYRCCGGPTVRAAKFAPDTTSEEASAGRSTSSGALSAGLKIIAADGPANAPNTLELVSVTIGPAAVPPVRQSDTFDMLLFSTSNRKAG